MRCVYLEKHWEEAPMGIQKCYYKCRKDGKWKKPIECQRCMINNG